MMLSSSKSDSPMVISTQRIDGSMSNKLNTFLGEFVKSHPYLIDSSIWSPIHHMEMRNSIMERTKVKKDIDYRGMKAEGSNVVISRPSIDNAFVMFCPGNSKIAVQIFTDPQDLKQFQDRPAWIQLAASINLLVRRCSEWLYCRQ